MHPLLEQQISAMDSVANVTGLTSTHNQLYTYTWVIPSGRSTGAVDSLFLLQSRIWTSSCPFEHEQEAGQGSRAQALRLNSMKTRAEGMGQPSAILNVFLLRAT